MYKYIRMCITDSRAEDVKESTNFTYLCKNNETEPTPSARLKNGTFYILGNCHAFSENTISQHLLSQSVLLCNLNWYPKWDIIRLINVYMAHINTSTWEITGRMINVSISVSVPVDRSHCQR